MKTDLENFKLRCNAIKMSLTYRINPDSHLVMLAVKALYVFAFVFFRDTSAGHSGNVWFLSIVLFVGSALVFMSFVINRPYFENQIQQVTHKFDITLPLDSYSF